MSILSTILKVVGLEKTDIAIAKELDVEDPKDEDLEAILKANEIKKEL